MEFLKKIVAWFKALICGIEALEEAPEKIASDQAVLSGAVSYSKPHDQQPVVIYEEREEPEPVEDTTAETEQSFQYHKLGYVMDRYIQAVSSEKAASTIKGYLSIRKNYFLELQDMGVNEITAAHVQAALNSEMRRGLSLKTVQNAYRFLKNVLDYASQEHLIQQSINLEYVRPREIALTGTTE